MKFPVIFRIFPDWNSPSCDTFILLSVQTILSFDFTLFDSNLLEYYLLQRNKIARAMGARQTINDGEYQNIGQLMLLVQVEKMNESHWLNLSTIQHALRYYTHTHFLNFFFFFSICASVCLYMKTFQVDIKIQ